MPYKPKTIEGYYIPCNWLWGKPTVILVISLCSLHASWKMPGADM